MLDAKSIKQLKKTLNPHSFRFVVILYDTILDIDEVKSFIKVLYPQNISLTLDIQNKTYNDLASDLYKNDKSFIYIDDFYELLNDKENRNSFNQRRDKISQYNINLICFYPKAISQDLYRNSPIYISDLWEFRSAVIELQTKEKFSFELIKEDKEYISLGGLSLDKKYEEIHRLKNRLQNNVSKELRDNIYFQLGKIFDSIGKYNESLNYYKKSLKIQVEIGDKRGEGTTLNNIATVYKARGELAKALEYLEKALKIQVEIGDKSGEGRTLNNISQIYDARGELAKALEYLEKSLKIRDKRGEGATLNSISQIYQARGELAKALEYLEKALKIQVEIGDKLGEGTTLNNISQIYDARGELAKALEYLEKSLKIQVEIGDKAGEGATLNNISQVYKARGELAKALEYLEKSLKIRVEIGDKSGYCATRFNMGHIYMANKNQQEAIESWVEVYALAKEIEEHQVLEALDDLAKGSGFDNWVDLMKKLGV